MWRALLLLLLFVINFATAEERCGTLEGDTIAFDSSYIFFQITYKGVDYWGGENNKDLAKGCLDPISSVVFVVRYPSFSPPDTNNFFLKRNRGNLGLDVREYQGATSSTLRERLYRHLVGFDIPTDETRLLAVTLFKGSIYDSRLGLYKVKVPSRGYFRYREVFWSERNGSVDVLFSCQVFPKAQGTCDQYWFDHRFKIQFDASYVRGRLSRWRTIRVKSEKLLESFIIRGK
ncbi:hypothetical protein [Pseudomonas synxantha]|uniref:Uncharacterized protein n=1 Tax=Pseudomonas synxantha TaxID=47883 RepID=A0ACC6JSA5_9PSED|nr:hypothetical protein [Pseudomonas synxantha]MDR6609089.1 hypothetical protein [Pseudomonas synxantha]